jgi:hypothetical protein
MANEQKINEFIDFSALENEKQRVVKVFTDLVSELQSKTSGKVSFMGDAKNITEATKAIQENEQAAKKQKETIDKTSEAYIRQKQVTDELNKQKRLEVAASNELTGAWDRARAKGQLLDKQARDLGFSMYELEKAGKKGTAEYQKLETEFQRVSQEAFDFNAEIKKVDAGINIHSKNVGNYEGAVTSLRQEIKNLTQTLATMEMQGKNNSKEYNTMVMRLGELKDAVGDVQARSKFFADDARYINTAVQAVQGLIGAYSVYVGVAELVGGKNEELEKIMRKMMALMTVMQGMQQVANMLNKDSYVRVAANVAIEKLRAYWVGVSTVVINAETGATQKATAAQIAYNVAKKASKGIIGLIVVAISALVAAMVAVTKIQEKRAAQVIKEMSMSDEQIEMYKQLTQAQKKSLETTAQEVVSAEILFKALAKTNEGSKERKKSINDINTAYGTYLPNLLTEKSSLTDIAAAHWLIVDAIKAKLQAEVAVEAAKTYVQRGAQLQAEKKNYEDQVKLINDYNKAMQDYQTRAQAGTLKPFELAPELPAQVATLGTAYQALEKIEPKLEAVTIAIGANNSAMNMAISSAATATAGLNILTYSHEENKTAVEKTTAATHEFYKEIEDLYALLDKSITSKGSKFLDLQPQLKKQFEHIKEFNDLVLQNLGASESEKTAALLSNEEVRYAEELLRLADNYKAIEEATKIHVDNVNAIKNGEDIKPPKDGEDGSPYDWKDYFSEIGSGANDTFSGISDLMDTLMDKELSNFKTVQDEKLRVLNERLRLGYISEEQYIADKSDLDIEYDKKKKELEKEQFKRTKAMAYAEAVINGALAAVEALNAKTTAMMIIKLAFVASALSLQLAKIQAQTPGFEKGRKDGPGTFAKVGEGGWEFTGDGTNIFKTPNSTTLTYLKPHQWVMPHAESVQLEKVLGTPTVNQITTQRPQQQDKELINAINKLAKKPTAVVNMDAHGIRAALTQGANSMNFVNNHILFKN